jgi:hypothetical protein
MSSDNTAYLQQKIVLRWQPIRVAVRRPAEENPFSSCDFNCSHERPEKRCCVTGSLPQPARRRRQRPYPLHQCMLGPDWEGVKLLFRAIFMQDA